MWIYSYEIPIFMMLSIILAFYFSRPRLPVRKNRTFMYMILIETITIIADTIASAMDNNYASYSILSVNVINMLYFAAFFSRSYIMYLFSAVVLKDPLHGKKPAKYLIGLPFYFGLAVSIISMAAGSFRSPRFIYHIDEYGYHSGYMYNLLYVCGFFYVLAALILFFMYGKQLNGKREKYGILFCNLIIFAALVIRLTLPKFLVMDIFVMMAILIVFLTFINPEFFLELKGTAFNSVALTEHLEESGDNKKASSLGVAIHSFHEMRDIYGSSQMEEGLTMIARFLKKLFPKGLIFYCRTGRFIILDRSGTDLKDKIHEITERFTQPWKSQSAELYLSAGFATFSALKESYPTEIILSTIMKVLDTVGKTDRGETFVSTEENVRQTETEKWIRKCIETALDDTGFELYLQPIVEASTGKITGAEALSRIRDTEGKIIPPGMFIPVAENSGRINGLGELVFDRTCKYIRETDLEKIGLKWINVNLSPLQFLCTDLADKFSAIVDKYGIDPHKIHLEITENAMIDDNFLQKQIGSLGEKGFVFVLDDYGTGYSNLSRLKKCPFSNVKLDMSIVWDYCSQPDDILPNMIQTLKKMGFSITAEGIEDENMEKTMKDIGCDFLQGYHYSKPVPAAELASVCHVNKQ